MQYLLYNNGKEKWKEIDVEHLGVGVESWVMGGGPKEVRLGGELRAQRAFNIETRIVPLPSLPFPSSTFKLSTQMQWGCFLLLN